VAKRRKEKRSIKRIKTTSFSRYALCDPTISQGLIREEVGWFIKYYFVLFAEILKMQVSPK